MPSISRLLKIIGLFCRISSLWQGSFAKENCNFKEPTHRSHPISSEDTNMSCECELWFEYSLFYWALLQKRSVIWRSLHIVSMICWEPTNRSHPISMTAWHSMAHMRRVFFAEYGLFYRALLQKRRMISRIHDMYPWYFVLSFPSLPSHTTNPILDACMWSDSRLDPILDACMCESNLNLLGLFSTERGKRDLES